MILYTIGHSNHPPTRFLELLARAEVTAVADVRSQPVSRWAPQYNKDALMSTLEACGIAYFYMGRELGGRPKEPGLRKGAKPDYAKMAKTAAFRDAIARLKEECTKGKLALMCAEQDPANCHRFHLIARELAAQGVEIAHILPNGEIETQAETEQRLRGVTAQADLFG